MFEDFIAELTLCLQDNKIHDIDEIISQFRARYEFLLTSGKSEFECIITLGDPQEIADKISGKDISAEERLERNMIIDPPSPPKKGVIAKKLPSKAGIIMTDIFYMTPITIIAAAGIIALAFISGLVGFAGLSYCIISWTVFATLKAQLLAFGMSVIAVIMFIGGAVLTVWLIKSITNGIKEYRRDRREKLLFIVGKELEGSSNDKTV